MKIKPLMLLPPLLFAALAVVFAVGMFRDDPNALPSAREGQHVPPMTLTALSDKLGFSEEQLNAPGVKLVNFWASWCAPCRAEHPNLDELSREGIPIYGINYKDSEDKALGFLKELGDPYRGHGADAEGRTALDWGLYGVPETYVVDGNGVIVLRFAGPITQRVLADNIRPAIKEAQSR